MEHAAHASCSSWSMQASGHYNNTNISIGNTHEQKGGLRQNPAYNWLPPGFRFHPTDEELVTYYLAKKIENPAFTDPAISEVDLNKCEPWDLPGMAKMGEKEWYFYSVRDRKYPSGVRTNRATDAGYWKATGKDREVMTRVFAPVGAQGNMSQHHQQLVGMKKTLVFYKGRAPKGDKTNWVMHEYRVEAATPTSLLSSSAGTTALINHIVPKDEWVICRIFNKSYSAKREPGLMQSTAMDRHHSNDAGAGAAAAAAAPQAHLPYHSLSHEAQLNIMQSNASPGQLLFNNATLLNEHPNSRAGPSHHESHSTSSYMQPGSTHLDSNILRHRLAAEQAAASQQASTLLSNQNSSLAFLAASCAGGASPGGYNNYNSISNSDHLQLMSTAPCAPSANVGLLRALIMDAQLQRLQAQQQQQQHQSTMKSFTKQFNSARDDPNSTTTSTIDDPNIARNNQLMNMQSGVLNAEQLMQQATDAPSSSSDHIMQLRPLLSLAGEPNNNISSGYGDLASMRDNCSMNIHAGSTLQLSRQQELQNLLPAGGAHATAFTPPSSTSSPSILTRGPTSDQQSALLTERLWPF